jgi:hypothetical protein
VYYASTETFPTTNVLSSTPEEAAAAAVNRRGMLNAHRTSIDTVPFSNISGDSESRLTAIVSVGETTTSDLTTTTGGTFDTMNAVVPGDCEPDVDHDNEDVCPIERMRTGTNRIVEEEHDEEDDSGVLMHTMVDENDDVPLEELFANAQLNSDQKIIGGNPQDENHHDVMGNTNPQIMVEMDTDPALSRGINIDDHVQSVPLVDLENPPVPPEESTSRGTPSTITANSAPASSVDNTTPSIDEERNDGAINSTRSLTSADATKKCGETKEDVSEGMAGTAAIAATPESKEGNPHDLESIKPHNQSSSPQIPYRLYFCRATVMALVLLVVILSASLFYTRDEKEYGSTSAPTILAPTPAFSSPSPSFATTQSPTMSPAFGQTESPTSITPAFETTATFEGQEDRNRFGTETSLSSTGDFVAALSLNVEEPVRTFQWRGSSGWVPFPSLPLTSDHALNSSSSALEAAVSLDVAITLEGFPAVAVSFGSGFQVYEYRGSRWVERGQMLQWETSNAFERRPLASSTAIQLSADASQLATGYVSENARSLVVQCFDFDANTGRWLQMGDVIRRDRTDNEQPFIALSLALSGNGRVLAVGDWTIGNPQAVVERFEWSDNEWSQMGQKLDLPWGPVSISLSHSGYEFAQVNVALGSASEWDGTQWNDLGNGFVGGSSLSISGDGNSIVVGDAVQGTATILGFVDDAWQTLMVLNGSRTSRFGESVSMSRDGKTLSIGSPLEDGDGNEVGQITLFQ